MLTAFYHTKKTVLDNVEDSIAVLILFYFPLPYLRRDSYTALRPNLFDPIFKHDVPVDYRNQMDGRLG